MYYYTSFDLFIHSDIALPLRPAAFSEPDIVIRQGYVPDSLGNVQSESRLFYANASQFLLRVPGGLHYLVESGRKVAYRMDAGADAKALKTHLLASVMGAVLHQRSLAALHCSAVNVDGQAVIFGGVSGIGKSSIAKQLSCLGFPLLIDDLSVLRGCSEKLELLPGYPFSRLWQDSMDELGIDSSGLDSSLKSLKKFIVPHESGGGATVPVRAIVVLGADGSEAYHLQKLSGGACFEALTRLIFRRRIKVAVSGQASLFKLITTLAHQSKVYALNRPMTKWDRQGLQAVMAELSKS